MDSSSRIDCGWFPGVPLNDILLGVGAGRGIVAGPTANTPYGTGRQTAVSAHLSAATSRND